MAQRIIRFFQDGSLNFEDISDVDILNPSNNEVVIYNNGSWSNIPAGQLKNFFLDVDILSSTDTVLKNTTYVVDVSNGPVTAFLPPNPEIGDFIRFVDQFSVNNGAIGFRTNSFTMTASPGFLVEDSQSLVLTADGDQAELVYIGNSVWKDISGLSSPILFLDDLEDVFAPFTNDGLDRYLRYNDTTSTWEARIIDFVESVNNYSGDVLLTANDIPETSLRFYFNRTKFLNEADDTNLDAFQDVEYDQPIFDANVLTWDAALGKWAPRSPGLTLDLDDLTDVVVDYDSATPFYTTEINDGEFYIVEYNETTMMNENVPTGIFDYDKTWFLSWQDNDTKWRTYTINEVFNRSRLTLLQDVSIPEFFSEILTNHGQALMWDANIKRWTPGGFVDLRDTDDLLMGSVNLYCLPSTLPSVARQSLHIGDCLEVADDLIDMSASGTFQNAGVLAWNPLDQEWQFEQTLTQNATTANIPEPLTLTQQSIPTDSDNANTRAYFTTQRHQRTIETITELLDLSDCQDLTGRTDGMVLTWNGIDSKWEPSNVAIGIFNTEHLPEGPSLSRLDSKYYSDQRVRDFLSGQGIPQTTSEWDKLNMMSDVDYDYTNVLPGESLVWDATAQGGQGAWVNGYPLPLPITSRGDLLVGIGDNDFDYDKIPVGEDGRYLRVDFNAQNLISWLPKEPAYRSRIQLPDIVRNEFTRALDLTDTFIFLGTNQAADPTADYVNPIGTTLNIYRESNGIPITYLTDRVFYNSTSIIEAPDVQNTSALFTDLYNGGNTIIDFLSQNTYRPEQIVVQARLTGNFRFKVSVSDDAIVWDTLQVDDGQGGQVDFEFELSVEMFSNDGIGENSQIISNDPILQDRYYYLITLPLFNLDFETAETLNDSFWRYVRLEPFSDVAGGVADVYEISMYGWFNNGVNFHRVLGVDNDFYMISGVNNLEFVLPGTQFDINEAEIEEGFQAWVISDSGHTTKIYTAFDGRIYNNTDAGDTPDLANPIIVPPKSMAKIIYGGRSFDSVGEVFFYRWHCNVIGVGSGGGGGGGTFALDRSNHIGTQDVSTITGLHPVATSGLYSDLASRPNLGTVATSNSYLDLDDLPFLGSAAALNAGTSLGNVVVLSANNTLPALDGSQLINVGGGTFNSPATTLGDLIVHNGTTEVRFGAGTDGFVLIADSTQPEGVRWGSVTGAGTDAATLAGQLPAYYLDRSNHTGTMSVAAVSGLHPVATSGNYNDLTNLPVLGNASSLTAGTLNGNVLLLSADNQLPALDGSLLTGVGSPLTTLGDIIVRGNGLDARLPVGTDGQILVVDTSEPLNVKWANPNAVNDAATLQGQNGAYYLDRTNHTGSVDALTDISNLATVATTGDYNDLINSPTLTLATVATTGEYADLLNLPTLGTSSQFNVGTGPFNIIQLDSQGNLPAGLSNSFALPTANKGDLLVHDGTNDTALPVGPDNYILVADDGVTAGVKWADLATLGVAPTLPTSLKGDLIVHDGTTDVALNKGLQGYLLSVDNSTATGLKWVDGTVLGGSPLTSRGDLYTYANGVGNVRLPVGTDDQILVADSTQSTGLKWIDFTPSSGNADTLNNQAPTFYLNRANHTGTQTVSTLSDAGNAITRDAGTLANQVLLISVDNQLPALDGSLLTNLPGGTGGDAATLDGELPAYYLDRANHTGTQLLATISDAGTAAAADAGTLTGQVLLLAEDNKLPALDGSLLTNVSAAPTIEQVSSTKTLAEATLRIVLLNSNAATLDITLPASPAQDDQVIFLDEAGSDYNTPTGLGLNRARIIANGGQTIQGFADVDMDVENSTMRLIYKGSRWNIMQVTY